MLILNINGPMNSGKSTVSKILAKELVNATFIEVDELMSDKEQEKLGLSLQQGWRERHKRLNEKLSKLKKTREYDTVIFAYPIADNTYQYWKALEDEQTHFINITLAPSLEKCLTNRGTRELTDWERNRIREMYEEGYQNRPYSDFIINNDNQTPAETTQIIKNFLKQKACDFTNYLGKTVSVTMDRPLGSKHPKHNFVYPINYGYIPNTISGDGEEIDAYVLGVQEPKDNFTGKCIAIIHRTNDNDDKLVVAPKNKDFSDKEIEKQVQFQEQWFQHIIIRKKTK